MNNDNKTENKSINYLFLLLDEAINNYEEGNIITEEQMMEELSSISLKY